MTSADSERCIVQVLWAAYGEDYPSATTPHHHDTMSVGGRRPFREEITLSLEEMTGVIAPPEAIEVAVTEAATKGWIHKDHNGFWSLTVSGYKVLFPATSSVPVKFRASRVWHYCLGVLSRPTRTQLV